MKLAEALIRRKALKENLEQLASRLKRIAKVQEGDTPAERPQELLTALEADLQELQTLIVQINRANLGATLADGTSAESVFYEEVVDTLASLLRDWVRANEVYQPFAAAAFVVYWLHTHICYFQTMVGLYKRRRPSSRAARFSLGPSSCDRIV